jgi:hypothetical protein
VVTDQRLVFARVDQPEETGEEGRHPRVAYTLIMVIPEAEAADLLAAFQTRQEPT